MVGRAHPYRLSARPQAKARKLELELPGALSQWVAPAVGAAALAALWTQMFTEVGRAGLFSADPGEILVAGFASGAALCGMVSVALRRRVR